MASYKLDTTHTATNFTVRHMMVTNVRGGFDKVSGTLEFDAANPIASSVEVIIEAASVNTGVLDRDNHLRSADFFEVEKYPNITFKSTKVEALSDTHAKVTGDLTIRDVTKSVVLDVEFLGQTASPFGDTRAGFEATANINREDFGLGWNVALEAGGVLVGKEIKLNIDAEAILVTETASA
jgi:polyisoprenoid-binding protein YceI